MVYIILVLPGSSLTLQIVNSLPRVIISLKLNVVESPKDLSQACCFFYSIYLPTISNRQIFFLFADDTDNLESLQNSVNRELSKLVNWLNVNRLALNVFKTNFVIFSAINKPQKPVTILINRQALEQKEFVKYSTRNIIKTILHLVFHVIRI